ncbi:MAG: hypothetical protein ABIG28_02275 [archaeon]|nr:hypothetical protein [Nanoarchaeota archaeon]
MGVLRGGALFVITVLLFWSLFVGNLFLTMNLSLDYDVVKPELVSVISAVLGDKLNFWEEVDARLGEMNLYCENNSGNTEFVFSSGQGQTFAVPCEVISQGSQAIMNYSIESFVEKGYYADYDCDFLDCLKEVNMEQPFVLVSAKAKDYWKSKFYFSLIVSFILIVLVLFLVEQKFNMPVVVGVLMITSSLSFMKINWILSFFSNEIYAQMFSIFFSKSYSVFLIMFILGIVVLAFGIVLRFFKFGFWISELIGRFVKKGDESKIVRKEVKNEKPVTEKPVIKKNVSVGKK